jgi:DNA-binding response OmpR family regulator
LILLGDLATRDRLHTQLNEIGYENARGYSSGREARTACKNNPPDILIVSSNMNDVSTVELIQRCRVDHPDVRVVVTSDIATNGEGISPLAKLADAKLISPFGMWELRQTMRIQISALDATAS